MNRMLACVTMLLATLPATAVSPDWREFRIPADAGPNAEWCLDEEVSDDFRYTFKPTREAATFGGKWINYYRGHWDGPGATLWRHENVAVIDGNLRIVATRKPGELKAFRTDTDRDGTAENFDLPATRLGCVTSVATVQFPAYVEARVKIANAVLASNVWMLSADSTQEIDILEAYGGRGADERADWFAQRIHVSHHVFIRRPFQDYQPKDSSTWYTRPGIRAQRGEGYWTGRYHRIGMHWRDPTHIEWYLDGEQIKTTSGMDDSDGKGGIDPLGYTKDDSGKRTGLSKPMNIIINMEAQDWNAAAGRTPTDYEIKRTRDQVYLVDWIRVYKPLPDGN